MSGHLLYYYLNGYNGEIYNNIIFIAFSAETITCSCAASRLVN